MDKIELVTAARRLYLFDVAVHTAVEVAVQVAMSEIEDDLPWERALQEVATLASSLALVIRDEASVGNRPSWVCASLSPCTEAHAEDSTLCPAHRDKARAFWSNATGEDP